ncbi:hypothetical protein B484DRAFT_101429 [Ochromonadaceae sp. CCMP2298]|nr:hypothetical protein B484DRAFT_101429 [Ochromonadaceae sp. CCMP2298]
MVTVDQADPEASMIVTNQAEERHSGQDFEAISADDFLPLFTYVLECGYYLATLEAATQHIGDLAGDFQRDQRQKDRGIGENGELVDFL